MVILLYHKKTKTAIPFSLRRYKGGSPPLIIYTTLRAAMIYQAYGNPKSELAELWGTPTAAWINKKRTFGRPKYSFCLQRAFLTKTRVPLFALLPPAVLTFLALRSVVLTGRLPLAFLHCICRRQRAQMLPLEPRSVSSNVRISLLRQTKTTLLAHLR